MLHIFDIKYLCYQISMLQNLAATLDIVGNWTPKFHLILYFCNSRKVSIMKKSAKFLFKKLALFAHATNLRKFSNYFEG